jgi:hypothetical protein
MVETKKTEPGNEKVRRPFVEPQIERQAKLPEVTNSFVGSFNP